LNGIRNDKASKLYQISNNEDLNDSQNVWSIDGKLYKEKSLEGKAIAVKLIKIVNFRIRRYFNEAKITQGLNHPNIVEIFYVLTVKSQLLIIMEYLNAGKHSSSVGSYSKQILEELYLNFKSYDFLKTFSYNGPNGRKLIFKN
jgi:hypothetical protein